MFVAIEHRGGRPSLAQRMLDEAVGWACARGFQRIFLETRSDFSAAIRLYERNGFRRIDAQCLPAGFPVIKVAEYFFMRSLAGSNAPDNRWSARESQ
jgi:hypothetical protein